MPGSPAHAAGLVVGDEVAGRRRRGAARHPRVAVPGRRARPRPRGAARRARADRRGAQGGRASRSASRCTRRCSTRCAPATTTASSASSTSCRPGLRKSLYLKDDDYRLSFLYGNFTTLTRFTEADLERVVTEGLSPLNVSIHATDPDVRNEMLRNRRGATSLRWLRALLDHGVEVHGQVVVCPGLNDGAVLDDTLAGVLDRYPELASLCVVPLGVSRYNTEARMRPHTAGRGRGGRRLRRGLAGASSCACSAAASCSPPTSTTCWPAARSPSPTPTRASRCTRTAWAWPAPSSWSSLGEKADATGVRGRLLRLGRRGRRRRRHRRRTTSPTAAPRATGGPAAPGAPVAAARPVGILTSTVRRPGARAAGRPPRRATTCASSRSRTSSSAAHLGHRADGGRGPRPGAGRRARGPPLPAARRVPLQRPLPRRHRPGGPAPAGRGRRHRRPRPAPRARAAGPAPEWPR